MKKITTGTVRLIKWRSNLFLIYLLVGAQLFTSAAPLQDTVSLNLEKTALTKIMSEIEAQSSYSFVYSDDEIDVDQKLSIKVSEEDLVKTLNKLFEDTSIQYLIRKKHIILSTKKKDGLSRKAPAPERFSISGIIKDASTGETLIGATVNIVDTNKGVIANGYGFYSLTLPAGTYNLKASFVGYEAMEKQVFLGENKRIDIELIEHVNELDEVVITHDAYSRSQVNSILLGAANMKREDIKSMPSLLGEADVTRAVLTQPGISSIGEGTTGFNVRGGNIDQNLILLDEAPIYNSSHLWGFFSVFNVDAIKDLKLYKGGIPARFGGRASSVLDIRQREGSNKKFKGEGGIGVLFSRLILEGPIKNEKVSFLLSGRRSYFDIFLGKEKAIFYDLSTKLTWNINQNNKVFVSGYFGADVMKFEDTNSDPNMENGKIDFRWKNATATVRWNHIFSSKLFMNVSGIYSRYQYGLSSENTEGPLNTSASFRWESAVENWIFKPDLSFYQNADTEIKFGVNNTLYRFAPAKIKSFDTGINNIDFNTEIGLEIAPYLEVEKRWKKLAINAGLRYSWFGNFGPYDVAIYNPDFPKSVPTIIETKQYEKGEQIKSYSGFEPRLSVKYNIKDNQVFKMGYNRMFQYIHLISNTNAALPFDNWKLTGTYVEPLEVNLFSAGYAYDSPNKNYYFSMEAYYKSFKNMVEYKNGSDIFINDNIETQLLPAKGYSYGLEVGIDKNVGKLTGSMNYTYSVSKRKVITDFQNANVNDGNYYPSNYDRPHLLNVTANLKLNDRWNMGVFFTYQSGRPITQPTGRVIFDGQPYLTYSDRNAYRISDTHRMDISFTRTSDKPNKKWRTSWSYGIYNLYGRKNAFSVFSTFHNNQLRTHKMSVIGSLIPFITYNFKF